MGKGKRAKKPPVKINTDIEDEKVALSAIFGNDFEFDDESNVCRVRVFPHMAALEDNYVSVTLQITYVS